MNKKIFVALFSSALSAVYTSSWWACVVFDLKLILILNIVVGIMLLIAMVIGLGAALDP